MRRFILNVSLISIACLIMTSCQSGKQAKQSGAFANEAFKIKRGTNVAHWLSQSNRRGQERAVFFTEKDVKYIDSLGFDHIRLPIDEEQMWDEAGKRHEDAFALMKNCLDWCSKAGLRVIIDLHILRSHHFNEGTKPLWTVPAEQDKFIAFWKDLSSFLKEYPNGMVAYEPMNEPVADDPEQWNQLLGRLIDSVRIWEPARVLVLGSNRWQSAATFDTFRVPENDTNLILSFHFYEPFFLTHYKAGWTNLKDFEGKVNYPGQIVLDGNLPEHKRIYNIDTLEYMMRKPIAMGARLKLPVYCGEFGIYMEYFPEAKLAWYRDMISIFEKHNIAYANWNYKSGAFGIVDDKNVPFAEVTKILLGKK
jgi:endoglucanase